MPVDDSITGHFVRLDSVPIWVLKSDLEKIVRLSIQIEEGYHLLAPEPAEDSLIDIRLEIEENELLQRGSPRYSLPSDFYIEGLDQAIKVHHDKLDIELKVKAKQVIDKKQITLQASLSYQACNEKQCFFPKVFQFPVVVKLE